MTVSNLAWRCLGCGEAWTGDVEMSGAPLFGQHCPCGDCRWTFRGADDSPTMTKLEEVWQGTSSPEPIAVRDEMIEQLWALLLDFTGPLEEELDPFAQWSALLDRVRWLVRAHQWACPELEYPDLGDAHFPEVPRVLRALVHPEGAPTIRLDLGRAPDINHPGVGRGDES